MSILVTGVGGDIGQSIVKCLRDSFPFVKLIGCDIDPYAAGGGMVDIFEQVPRAKNLDFMTRMDDTIRKHSVTHVYPSTEVEIDVFNWNRSFFTSVKLLILDRFTLFTFADKYETVLHLKRCGLPYPRSFLVEEFDNQIGYPFLLKARRGWGGRGLIEISSLEEFEFYKSRVTTAIVQEIVGTVDEEYTVGVFSDGVDVHSICFRRYLGYGSMSKFVELVHDDKLHAIVETIARSCKLFGSLNVQLRKTDKGYVPFEVNARISSTAYFRHCFGFQDVRWWIDLLEGRPIEYELKYQKGIGVRTIGETFFGLE